MADMKNHYGALLVVDFVHQAVVSDTDAPPFPGGQLEASLWPRISGQSTNCVADARVGFGGKLRQFFLCAAQDEDGVIHLRPDSISAIACSNGTA